MTGVRRSVCVALGMPRRAAGVSPVRSQDVADRVVYLASDEARYLTGTELVIDGGLMAGQSVRRGGQRTA